MPNGRTRATCPATSTTVVRMKRILALLIATPPCWPRGALEADVLQRLGCPSVQPRGTAVVVPLLGEVAERDPGGCTVAGRGQLLEAPIGGVEDVLSLGQAILLNEGAAERQLGGADLGQVVDPVVEQLERLAGLGFGLLESPHPEVDLGER